MRVIAVDDEPLALEGTLTALGQIKCVSECVGFLSPVKALEYYRANGGEVALLDIEMGKWSGLTLAKELKDINPEIRIVFVTGFPQYASDAFRLRASGYVLKPAEAKDIEVELDAILHPPAPIVVTEPRRIRAQCFGNFELFVDGQPLAVARSKSKELLAYLIDRRGAGCGMAEIAAILWEDGDYDMSRNRQIHIYISELARALDAVGAKDILVRQYKSISVDPSKFDCDFYDCISGDPAAINSYAGEYMAQYSWAEFTAGELSMKYK